MSDPDADLRHYIPFYAAGGWRYDMEREVRWLRERLVEPLGLAPGLRVLDFGCGRGDQTEAWRRLGFAAVGVDRCPTGIEAAQERFPEGEYHCADAATWAPPEDGRFDLLFIRGMSWYHYHLGGGLLERTREVCRRVLRPREPGPLVALCIKTDFSGRRDETTVIHNHLITYLQFFCRLGDVVLCTDWRGRDLLLDGCRGAENIVIVARTGK